MLGLSRTAFRAAARAPLLSSTSSSTSVAAAASSSIRHASTLRQTLEEVIPEKQEFARKLKVEHGNKSLGEVKVENVFGGMRGLKIMLWQPSVLDAEEGIRFWGKTIPECQAALPSSYIGDGGKEMLPESMLWFLLTGKVPNKEQVKEFGEDLARRSMISKETEKVVDSFPKEMHPMTQFVAAVATLNQKSAFVKAYNEGMKKSEYWKPTLEDSLDCIAKSFTIAARIYRNKYIPGGAAAGVPEIDVTKDLSWNFANQIGFVHRRGFVEIIRLYNALHTDHEGGNVSAHTTHLVGSALSDPFLSYSAALAGLAGPLHGLANQEALKFILTMQESIGNAEVTNERVKEELWKVLKSGRVVPGYGHAVLRKPDPRFTALQAFGHARPEIQADPVFQLVSKTFEVAPDVLTEHGKTKNPFPNVDAGSGVLLNHYGLKQFEYYTVVFGTSRAMGALSQLVWDRALGLPIERPKSLSLEAIAKIVGA